MGEIKSPKPVAQTYEPPEIRFLGSVSELTNVTTGKLSVQPSDETLKTAIASIPAAIERLRGL